MNKLYQISTPTCPPCRRYRKLISELPKEVTTNYIYLDVTTDAVRTSEYIDKFKIQGVPRFLLLDERDEIVEDFGHSGKSAIEYMVGMAVLKNESDEEE